MVAVGVVGATGTLARWDDATHLAFGIALALPVIALPWLIPGGYASRAVLFLSITTLVQMRIGSLLFFDRLGMEYHFHVTWTLDRSPLFLYPLTLAYFATAVMSSNGTVFFVTLPGYLALDAPRPLSRVAVDALWRNALCLALYLVYAMILPHLHGGD